MGNVVADGVNKFGDAVVDLSDLISSKKEYALKQIANALLLLIILLVFGCFDFLHLTFHYEYLFDPNFWISVGTKAAADIASYNIGINVIIDDVINRNKVLREIKRTYEKLNKYKDEDFVEFINEYNRDCKIQAYKNKIIRKIYLLNKTARQRDKLLYANKLADAEVKKKNRYCVKRTELEQLKTDEYIKSNIDALDIKYKDVDPAVFELEINGSQKVVENKVTGSVNHGRIVLSLTTMLGIIAVPIINNAWQLDPNKEEFEDGVVAGVNYAIKMATDIGIIIWQFTRGMFSTSKIVSTEITTPLSLRVKILKKYYAWRTKKGLWTPQCYLDLLKEENKKEEETPPNNQAELVVELSPEQYEQFMKEQQKK